MSISTIYCHVPSKGKISLETIRYVLCSSTLESCSPNSSSFCCRGVLSCSVAAIWSRIFPISVETPVATAMPMALPAAMLVPWLRVTDKKMSFRNHLNQPTVHLSNGPLWIFPQMMYFTQSGNYMVINKPQNASQFLYYYMHKKKVFWNNCSAENNDS